MGAGMAASVLKAMRPKQWSKNVLVLAGYIFALGDKSQTIDNALFWDALGATAAFCLVSSAVYLFNDVRDCAQDRQHPEKRKRPVAAGDLSKGAALAWSFIFMLLGLGGALMLSMPFAYVLALYLVLQFAYNAFLKNIELLDVFVIAAGFVLRALGGAVVIGIAFSPWLLLCTLLLALFLALCKRRHEKVILNHTANNSRPVLAGYDAKLLDQLIAIVSAATIVCYSLYTLWPDTVEKFDTNLMALTIPFVIFGVFRYLDLVYRHKKGDKPEQILLTDGPLLIDIALYGIAVLWILLGSHPGL